MNIPQTLTDSNVNNQTSSNRLGNHNSLFSVAFQTLIKLVCIANIISFTDMAKSASVIPDDLKGVLKEANKYNFFLLRKRIPSTKWRLIITRNFEVRAAGERGRIFLQVSENFIEPVLKHYYGERITLRLQL